MDWKVRGDYLLIKVSVEEEVTESGIVISKAEIGKDGGLSNARTKTSACVGVIEQLGSDCYTWSGCSEPWCKVGDRVIFPMYEGDLMDSRYPGIAPGETYRVLADNKIIGVLEREQ